MLFSTHSKFELPPTIGGRVLDSVHGLATIGPRWSQLVVSKQTSVLLPEVICGVRNAATKKSGA